MQHNAMLITNVEIDQAELREQAQEERRARRAIRRSGSHRGFLGRLLRR